MAAEHAPAATMVYGATDADTARLNGWTVGTLLRGYEQWGPDTGVWSTWRITAIGEERVLVRTIRRDYTGDDTREPNLSISHETTATFVCRNWFKIDSELTPPPQEVPS